MASKDDGNKIAGQPRMTVDYGQRAARALDRLLPQKHRNKAVQRAFDCCPRQAQNLRAGLFWTVDRLNQASAIFGAAFDMLFAGGEPAMDEIAARIARLEDRTDEVFSAAAEVIPPPSRTAADRTGRKVPPTSREGKVAEIGSPSLRARR